MSAADKTFASGAEGLSAAGRSPPVPCEITFGDGQTLTVTRWLRILPGKRLTGFGRLNGQAVVAKLFIAENGSERHWQRECNGSATLRSNDIPAPGLLASGRFGANGHFVVYGYLADTHAPSSAEITDLLMTFEMLGRMHARGLLHEDAHLDNFLLDAKGIYVIDGDAIQQASDSSGYLNNLALLFAQLPMDTIQAMRRDLLAAYRLGNPHLLIEPAQLDAAIADARALRMSNFLDKCLRDCSRFEVQQDFRRFVAIVRDEAALLAPIVADPDRWIEEGTPLKQGRTATLALVELGGRQLVIKRYNIKGPVHALSRCWRPSRAWHSWIEGHRLRFLGIATPRPLALIENRFGPLRSTAWLINDYCPGKSLSAHLAPHLDSPPQVELAAIGKLFRQLATARISHGDLKASNLLWHEGQVYLVDLDAMQRHENVASFHRAWRKDRERFMRNWTVHSALHATLAQVLP